MADVLVVGVGSELRSDDAAGRRVAEAIDERALPGVAVSTSIQLVPELVEAIGRAGRVVFVDASVATDDVVVRRLAPQAERADSHHTTPDGLLGLVAALGRSCPPAFLVEVPATDLSLGEGLSDTTARAIDRAVAEVVALIDARRPTSPT